jgi:1,3-beta-glucan synthase
MSGDVPRAAFANLFFGEIVAPLVLVAVTLIPYLFINAQTGVSTKNNPDAKIQPTASLLRVAIVAFAPIAINAGVLAGIFGMACCMGPVLSMCCKKFGTVLAAIAHGISVVMLLVFFEVMLFLEGIDFPKAVLGMIAAAAIQRFFYKLIIALALTREFKTDTSNIAFWTGKWYSMGWHSMSQPAREYLCKITELGMFAGDFVLGHLILFSMLPIIAIPQVDKLHSVMLFWLRPRYLSPTFSLILANIVHSRQIRPPIYSLKQSKLRRRRVWRYAILYFVMFVIFLALAIGPVVAGAKLNGVLKGLSDSGSQLLSGLVQPTGLNNNDTRDRNVTGTGLAAAAATSSPTATARIVKLF